MSLRKGVYCCAISGIYSVSMSTRIKYKEVQVSNGIKANVSINTYEKFKDFSRPFNDLFPVFFRTYLYNFQGLQLGHRSYTRIS